MEKDLFDIIKNSKSKNDAICQYYGYANKNTYLKFEEFIKNNKIDILHFDKPIIKCMNCGKTLKNTRNKFCNSSCAATYNNNGRIVSKETKNKIRNKLVDYKKNNKQNKIRYCAICNEEFIVCRLKSGKLSKTKCCSDKCRDELRSITTKNIMLNKVENGTHKGWATRNIISYPEQFFIEVLKNNNIEFKHNFPVNHKDLGMNSCYNYFLDFFMNDKNIDLEIDGQQHNYRQEHDNERDNILKENGFIVYRIKWKDINNKIGKKYIEEEIKKFLEFYKNS